MGKDSDREIVIPQFSMPDLTEAIPDADLDGDTGKPSRRDRKILSAIYKLTRILNALVEHTVKLTEAVRLIERRQKTPERLVMASLSKFKIGVGIVLISILSGAGAKMIEWVFQFWK